ncbi:hypothetical protein DFH28DRAFT_1109988 [Melampsora americana]|nr:hypothetical protein DFH28DRAFT_1109988 [Melampsora americana]
MTNPNNKNYQILLENQSQDEEDQEFKKVKKHLESLALRESIKRKSIRNHSNLKNHQKNPLDFTTSIIHHHHQSSNIVNRSQRVQSAFIEHCQWTDHEDLKLQKPKPLTKVTEEESDEYSHSKSSTDLNLNILTSNLQSSTHPILPNPSSKSHSNIILNDQKSSKYFSVHSLDTLVSTSNQSSQESQTLISPPSKRTYFHSLSNSQDPFLIHQIQSNQPNPIHHQFKGLNETEEIIHPTSLESHPLHSIPLSNLSNHSRPISFLDWVLCNCCITDDELIDQYDG